MKSIEDIPLLYDISEALNEHLDLKKSLYKVLEILSTSHPTRPGFGNVGWYLY